MTGPGSSQPRVQVLAMIGRGGLVPWSLRTDHRTVGAGHSEVLQATAAMFRRSRVAVLCTFYSGRQDPSAGAMSNGSCWAHGPLTFLSQSWILLLGARKVPELPAPSLAWGNRDKPVVERANGQPLGVGLSEEH